MKLLLYNTFQGLVPCYDKDYDEKKKLKIGEYYESSIKLVRNIKFHRKFFALINLSWQYLPEHSTNFFKKVDLWREYVLILAGYTEPYYSPTEKKWLEKAKSISFDAMDQAQFDDVYNDVSRVIFQILSDYITEEDFNKHLSNF